MVKFVTMRRTGALAGVVALALGAAACGDDSGGSDRGTSTDAVTDAAEETTGAQGDPVKVMIILDESEEAGLRFDTARAGAEVRVDEINAGGGLGGSGRPVEIEYCVTELDPNEAAACAEQAADDEDIVAVVAGVIGNGDVVNPILEEAGIANIGSTAFSASDGLSPISFPVMGGLIAAVGCQGSVLVDEADATDIAVAYGDTPGAEQSVALLDLVLGERDLAVENTTIVPVGKADVSAEVTSVTEGADGLVTAMDGETAKRVIRTARQQGIEIAIAGSGAQQFTPEAIDSLGDAADGLYLALWFATDEMPGRGVEEYVHAMEDADASDQSDDLAKNSWLAFGLLDQAARGQQPINRTTILEAMGGISKYDTDGLSPTLDFTTPGTFLDGAQPRIVNTTCVYAQIEDGEIVALDEAFIDPFDVSSG
jgi:ABC-type branched-subunit amino acid transport system substrate-binding protein